NYYSDYWNGYRIEWRDGGFNQFLNPLTFGDNPVVEGQSQAFTLTIDYNAGALDTGTLIIDGDSTVYDIDDYDYSFDEISFSAAFESAISATNISVSIVPEPATYALLSGALALVFVALRRRFKA
ncbi:MAG: PEP-CTERM sorting domain-containing protein, partial [Opitutales bacterium]